MSITIDVPPDLAADARLIPDLPGRVASFVRQQVELERWRSVRYRPEVTGLVNEARKNAGELRGLNKTREQLFREFRELSSSDTGREASSENKPTGPPENA